MANFNYVAFNQKGKRIAGKYESDTRDQVADYLHGQGLTVISINEDITESIKKLGSFQIGGIPIKERVIFAKQLSVMLSAGVPVLQALHILTEQSSNESIKDKLKVITAEVEAGNKLSDAFSRNQSFFNDVEVNLLAAGEKSGNLNQVLDKIADDLEKSKVIRGKIRGAMIYPAIILFVLVIVIGIVVVFMVPSVKSLYDDLGAGELPAITQSLVTLSNILTQPLGIAITLTIAIFGFVGFRYYNRTPVGRHNIDKLILKMPVFGDLVGKVQISQFCRLLAMLIKSGVPIVESLNIVAKSMGNVLFREAIENAAKEVVKGTAISIPLSLNAVFPQILLKIIATGEDTGNLDNVLEDMGKFYAAEVDEITNNLTKLMEPLILLIVGGLVGFIAIAVYLPIYSLGQNIS